MNVIDELAAVCGLLDNGVIDGDKIETLLRESELEHKDGRLSLHRSISDGRCEVKDQIVIQLRQLERNRNDRKRDEIALSAASRMRGLLELFVGKHGTDGTETHDIDAIVGKKFLKAYRSKGSQNDKATKAEKSTRSEWDQFKAEHRISNTPADYFYKLVLDCDGDKMPKWLQNLK